MTPEERPDTRMRHLYARQTPAERATTLALLAQSGSRRSRRSPSPPIRSRHPAVFPPPLVQVTAGHRTPRTSPLTRAELYVGGVLPAHLTTTRPSQRCSICCGVKAHPVSYACGHSHCYACIRLHLETSWRCPLCPAILQAPPHRHWSEEQAILEDHPDFVRATQATYSWDGLFFPRGPFHDE
ncbi:hypothetical protein C8R46DRAFT_1238485 [Mycena filopes]|nr:hypothetical protein C8R46DRAFT_1238485 [Mycena filopes]